VARPARQRSCYRYGASHHIRPYIIWIAT